MIKKLPLALTLSRIVGAPVLLIPFIENKPWVWLFLAFYFVALSITDYFDGKLARKYNVVSNFGKYFDPTGDKILVLIALVILMYFKNLNPFITIILLSRDILISSIRSYSASMGFVMDARPLGKIKTTFQMIAVPLLMAPQILPNIVVEQHQWGLLFMWSACILSVWSLGDYALQLNKNLKGH